VSAAATRGNLDLQRRLFVAREHAWADARAAAAAKALLLCDDNVTPEAIRELGTKISAQVAAETAAEWHSSTAGQIRVRARASAGCHDLTTYALGPANPRRRLRH
jgi:hypothetical protein